MKTIGTFFMPGDKSMSHRAIILAALTKGTSIIKNFLFSEDTIHTLKAVESLGVEIIFSKNKNTITVISPGKDKLKSPSNSNLYLGNSGTGSRLLMGALAGLEGIKATISGDESLSSRPMKRLIEPLKKLGAKIHPEDHLPVEVLGTNLVGPFHFIEETGSAQVKSAVALAALNSRARIRLEELKPSRNHTENMLKFAGVDIEFHKNGFSIPEKSILSPSEYVLWGDISSASFFIVLALLSNQGGVIIKNVSFNKFRSHFIDVLIRMGANIIRVPQSDRCGEPGGDLIVRPSVLHGTQIKPDEIPSLIDEIPILCIAGVFASGDFEVSGAKELRFKESDRISSLVKNLKSLGVSVEEYEDGFSIKGQIKQKTFAKVDAYMDHRIAMSFEIASVICGGAIKVEGKEWVKTSFPTFYKLLDKAINPQPSQINVVTLDGPAGSGKSSLARELAKSRGFCQIDSGALYRTITHHWITLGKPKIDQDFIGFLEDSPPVIKFCNGYQKIIFNGNEVGNEIRNQEISISIKSIADHVKIRAIVNNAIRLAAKGNRIVADGRDMGSFVFPDASIKFFLTASLEERSKRRLAEFQKKNPNITLQEVRETIAHRDYQDENRIDGALKVGKGAILIDTTCIKKEGVLCLMHNYIDFFTLRG